MITKIFIRTAQNICQKIPKEIAYKNPLHEFPKEFPRPASCFPQAECILRFLELTNGFHFHIRNIVCRILYNWWVEDYLDIPQDNIDMYKTETIEK